MVKLPPTHDGDPSFESRKVDHLRLALEASNQAEGLSGLESIRLVHEALPDLMLGEISISSSFAGRKLATPFFVSGMTAGHAAAPRINAALAQACESRGWIFGVGSQRRELEAGTSPDAWSDLRSKFPALVSVANIGLSQIGTRATAEIARLVDNLGATALAVHANALQEAIQCEGTPNFKDSESALRRLCRELKVPVILKETGCGFSAATLARLADAGLAAVDVSGLGGTHWGRIEGARALDDPMRREAAETFADWGVSTVDATLAAGRALKGSEVWASGGVRTGLDAAKLIALGAHRVGFAKPALEAALGDLEGRTTEGLDRWMERVEFELKVALFCTGCASSEVLRQKERVWLRDNGFSKGSTAFLEKNV